MVRRGFVSVFTAVAGCVALAALLHAAPLSHAEDSLSNQQVGVPDVRSEDGTSAFGDRAVTSTIGQQGAYELPLIYVTNLALQSSEGNTLKGTFTAENKDQDVLAGLTYQVELINKDDLTVVYSRQVANGEFALAAGDSKEFSFTQDVSKLPAGTYDLRVQAMTVRGKKLGWQDMNVTKKTAEATGFVSLTAGVITLPEFNNQTVPALTGPNVNGGSSFTVSAHAENTENYPVTVTPVMNIYQFDMARGDPQVVSLAPFRLQAHESKDLAYEVKAPAGAGVYSVMMDLENSAKKSVSGLAEYRFVVRGAAADVISAKLLALGAQAGMVSGIRIDAVGAPDAETKVSAVYTVSVLDDKGVLGQEEIPAQTLKDGVASGIAWIKSTRDLVGTPTISIAVKDAKTGTVFTTYKAKIAVPSAALSALAAKSVPAVESPLMRQIGYYAILFCLALLLVGAAVLGARRYGMSIAAFGTHARVAVMVLLMAAAVTPVLANGIEVVTPDTVGFYGAGNWNGLGASNPVVQIFVNSPVHDAPAGTYPKNAVPYSFSVNYAVCDNTTSVTRVIIRVDSSGQKQSTFAGTNANWVIFYNNTASQSTCPPGSPLATTNPPDPNKHTCFANFQGNGTLDLSAVSGAATTLQFIAKYHGGCAGNFCNSAPDSSIVTNEQQPGISVDAVNVWVNFHGTEQCQNGIDDDGDGKIDYPADPGCTSPTDTDEKDPTVDLKINGSDGTISAPQGSTVTLTWTSTDAQRCSTGSSNMPGWTPNTILPPSGSQQVTVSQTGTYGIECSETTTSGYVTQDNVGVLMTGNSSPITPPINTCSDGSRLLVYSLQPAGSSPVYETYLSGHATQLNNDGYSTAYYNRALQPTITQSFLSQYKGVVFVNGCGGATGLLSSSELTAVKNYYQAGGNVMLAADDSNGDNNAQGDCYSRVNQIANNLGVNFSGLQDNTHTSNPPYCVGISSSHQLFNGVPTLGRYTGSNLQFTGNIPWGGSPHVISTITATAQNAEAIIESGNGHGTVLFDPDNTSFQTQCGSEQYLNNIAKYFGVSNINSCPNGGGGTCNVILASTYLSGANNSYAHLPSNLPSSVNVRSLNLYSHTLTSSDLQNADLFIYGDSHINPDQNGNPTNPYRTLSSTEVNLLQQAYNNGLNFTFAADNPTADEASAGTRQIFNAIQSNATYSATYFGTQAGTYLPNTTLYPFLQGKVFDFSNSGLNSPGDIVNVTSPEQCAFSLNGRCHASWLPAAGSHGFVFAEGNAGVGTQDYLRNMIDMACPPSATPQCSDGIDNDGDGATDYPSDFSCSSPSDNDETNPKAQCQDGIDNDGDGRIDYPADPGCTSKQDNSEDDNVCDQTTFINFDTLPNGTAVSGTANNGHDFKGTLISNQYQSAGAIFSSNGQPAIASRGDAQSPVAPSNYLVGNNGGSGYADSYYPIQMDLVNPSTGTVAPADRVDVTLISVGSAGLSVKAYNQNGQIVSQLTRQGTGDAGVNREPVTLTGSGITRVTFEPLNNTIPREDGFGIDDVRITFNQSICSTNQCLNISSPVQANPPVNNGIDLLMYPSNQMFVPRGGKVQMEIFVHNPTYDLNGNSLHNVLTQLTLQPGNWSLDFAGVSPGCTQVNGSQVNCQDGSDIPPRGQHAFIVTYNVPSTIACGTTLTFTANANTTGGPNASGSNQRTNIQVVCNQPPVQPPQAAPVNNGLQVLIYPSEQLFVPRGGIAQYAVSVHNTSNSVSAHNVLTKITLAPGNWTAEPSGLSPGCSQVSSSEIDCQDGSDIQPNGQHDWIVTYHMLDTMTCGSNLTLTANSATTGGTFASGSNQSTNVTVLCSCVNQPQCSDGIDNDGDGAIDYPSDFSCSSPTDTDETFPKAQCQDGIDNDGDGLIDYPQDPGCVSNQDNDESNPNNGNADLSISKTGPASVTRGGTATYAITVSNAGPGIANGVTITDPVPTGLSFNAGLSDSSCALNNAQTAVICNNFSLNAGSFHTVQVTFNVPTVQNCSQSTTVTNTATVTTTSNDPVSGNNQSQTVTTTVNCPTSFQCSNGIDDDQDGAIDYPNDFSCSDANDNDETNPKAQCQDGVDNDGDGLIDYPADPGCTSKQDNDESNVNNSGNADVSITKTGPSQVTRGSTVSYTLTASNAGPGTATAVVIEDQIPAGLTFNAALSSASCALNGAQTAVLCNNFSLVQNQTHAVQVVFNVPAVQNCTSSLTIQNTATVSTSATDPVSSNNTSQTVTTTATCPTSFQCSNGIDDDQDGAIDYPNDFSCSSPTDDDETNPKAQCQDGVDNDGDGLIDYPADPGCISKQDNDETNPAQCQDNIDNDQDGAIDYPADFSCSSPTDNDETNPKAQCQDGVDNDGDGLIDYPADPGCTSKQDNDESNQNNSGNADLSIIKTAPSAVTRGSTISYVLTASNAGPGTATNVVISDTFPAGLTASNFVAASSPGCVVNGSQTAILCNNFSLNSGENKTFTVVFNVPTVQNCSQSATFSNTAVISTSATDPVSSNNTSQTVTTTVNCPTSFQCSNGIDDDGDGAIDYPNDFSCSDANDNDETNPKAQCQDGVDNDGDGLIDYPADPGCTSKQDNDESNTNGNGSADLQVSLTGPSTTVKGSTAIYTATVTNNGPSTANNVQLMDPPTGFTFLPGSSSQGCSQNGAAVICTISTLAAGSSQTFTLAFTSQNATCNVTATDIATVSSSNPDPNPANNQSQVVSTFVSCNNGNGGTCSDGIDNDGDGLIDNADPDCHTDGNPGNSGSFDGSRNENSNNNNNSCLSLSINDDPDPAHPGEDVDYTLRVDNSCNTDRTITVKALLDNDMEFQDASGNGNDVSNDEVQWKNVTILKGSDKSFTLTVTMDPSLRNGDQVELEGEIPGDSETETTDIVSNNPNPNPNPNVSSLAVSVQPDRSDARPGDVVSYTITARNTGTVAFQNASLESDYTSGQLSILDAAGGTVNGTAINWQLGRLDPNTSRQIRYTTRMGAGMQNGDIVANNVTLTADGRIATASSVVRIVTQIPQTGISQAGSSGDGRFLSPVSTAGAKQAGETGGLAAILAWITTLTSGVGAGIASARKLFI